MNWHDAESQSDPTPLAGARWESLPVPIPSAKVSPKAALEAYWRQLELTPHRKITLGPVTLACRAENLRFHFRLTNGVISPEPDGALLGMNWAELGVVPVGGQGLTPQERTFCALAGKAMVKIFEGDWRKPGDSQEEGRNHDYA